MQADDKKKAMILGALALVMVGVGAFQMMPQDAPPSEKGAWKPPVEEAATIQGEKKDPVRNPAVVATLPRRDPFDMPDAAAPVPVAQSRPAPAARPVQTSQFRPRPPRRMGGRLSGGFSVPDFGELPPATVSVEPVQPATTVAANAAPVQAETPKAPEPTFDYDLSGVIVGRKSAVVLRDKNGNQKLVTAGSSIDGDATLVEVRQGAAIVKHRGKTLRIEMKGDKDAK